MVGKFTFSRDKARNALALGGLERSALEALWDHGEISGFDIFGKIGKKLKIHHNTLLTVLERLIAKGLVKKVKRGKNNIYSAILTREEFCARVADPIFRELLEVSSESAIAAFVQSASMDPEKLSELKRLIEEAENKQGKN